MFAERYVSSLASSDLRDDELHHSTDALVAAALADNGSGAIFGSLLCRVKYSDSPGSKTFEDRTNNLASLLRIWSAIVQEKGKSRGWVRIRAEWDIPAATKLYEHIASASLAYWLDSRCVPCDGTGVTDGRRTCPCCNGTRTATIDDGVLAGDRIKDMVSELEGVFQAHGGRAAAMLRRAA